MANSKDSVVIIGAGQAGGECAKNLRRDGFEGPIILVGDEAHLPYERPPLSKNIMSGAADLSSCYLWTPSTAQELDIDFRQEVTVTAIDRNRHLVQLAGGAEIPYHKLVLATGGRVRKLPLEGADHDKIYYLRSIADSLALQKELAIGKKLVVIGGGWIGLEVAATARQKGLEVTVLEAESRLCARAVPPEVSEFLARLHRENGVDVELDAAVEGFPQTPGGGLQVSLQDGRTFEADFIVVGIGLVPNIDLAVQAGLETNNGIVTTAEGRTSDPDIYAIGDIAHYKNRHLGRDLRLESWANAQAMAVACSKDITGQQALQDECPWFWSDQYDVNIQLLGVPEHWSAPVVRGNDQTNSYSLFYLKDDQVEAAITFNAARDMAVAKRFIQRRTSVSRTDLVDEGLRLQSLLKKK